MFFDFVNVDMTAATIQEFLRSIYADTHIMVSAPRNTANLLLVHNESEYAFTSDDLSWLSFSNRTFICETEFEYDVFCVEVTCTPPEYYTACAALIKLFTKAFSQKKLFLFRIGASVAFGCNRDFSKNVQGNFCVTQRFELPCEYILRDFLVELLLLDVEDLPWLIMKYSPQEHMDTIGKYDKMALNTDYLRFLDEFSAAYGVDTTDEYERYMRGLEESRTAFRAAYQEAKDTLANIAEEEDVSSYETLEKAIEAEEKYTSIQMESGQVEQTILSTDDVFGELSQEAFVKADVMLDEILNRL